MAFLTVAEISALGIGKFGSNTLISEHAKFYAPERITIGDNVRIDDFCIISAGHGGISIGSFIHIAAYSSLIGAGNITISDFSNISSRVSIYSSSDDYSGSTMTNPMVPESLKNVHHESVKIGRHSIIGCGAVILPGAELDEGVAVGALSLVKGKCDAFGIYTGTPAKKIKERSKNILELEKRITRNLSP